MQMIYEEKSVFMDIKEIISHLIWRLKNLNKRETYKAVMKMNGATFAVNLVRALRDQMPNCHPLHMDDPVLGKDVSNMIADIMRKNMDYTVYRVENTRVFVIIKNRLICSLDDFWIKCEKPVDVKNRHIRSFKDYWMRCEQQNEDTNLIGLVTIQLSRMSCAEIITNYLISSQEKGE